MSALIPLVLEIRSSIIFPRSAPVPEDPAPGTTGDAAIAITGEVPPFDPSPPRASTSSSRSASSITATGPDHPVYRLPQSLSSSGLKIHLNEFAKTKRENVNRKGHYSKIDEGHIIYQISRTSIGDSSLEYKLVNFRRGDPEEQEQGSGGYGKGKMKYVPGWFSGGTWEVSYVTKKPGQLVEQRTDLKCDDGGAENGIWKMVFPHEGVVARELEQPQGEFGENGKAVEILPAPEGWEEKEWRDFITAVFITKVWRDCTKVDWMGHGVKETAGLMKW